MATVEHTEITDTDLTNTVTDERQGPRRASVSSRFPAVTRSTRSSGRSATPSSRARKRPRSTRSRSSSRSSGRRRPRTSSRRSTSADSWARPSARRSVKQMIGRVVDTIGGWGRDGRLLRDRRRGRHLRGRAEGDPRQPARELQLPGLVQRRLRGEAAVLGLLHPLDRRLDGLDPRLDPPRGRHLPRRLGLRRQPLQAALLEGAAVEGRLRLRPRVVHARRRRVRRHDQVRRQDAARGQDGHPRRRPPGHRGVHLVQGARGAEGARARGGRLRHVARLAPTGARSSTRTRTTRCASPTRSWRPPRPAATGTSPRAPTAPSSTRRAPATCCARWPTRPGSAPTRACSTTRRSTTWHTCPNSGRINASNPCSEYMHLDDSACNLASLNLMKFRREDGELDVEAFEHAVDVMFLAQEIARRLLVATRRRDRREREGLPRSSASATPTSARC